MAVTLWLIDHIPGPVIKMMAGSSTETGPREDLVRTIRAITLSGAGWPQRRDGYSNDMSQFEQIEELPLTDIACPTLIVHGSKDPDVAPEHAVHAHEAIPDSRLEWITGGSHATFYLSPAAQGQALDWLASIKS